MRTLLLLVPLLGLLTAGAAAQPAAVLVHREGQVQLRRAGAPAAVEAGPGTELAFGDLLLVGAAGRAVVLYGTGKMVEATEPYRIEALAGGARSGLFDQTLRTLSQVASVDADARPNRQGMVRPIPGEPTPVHPRDGITVATPTPTFAWHRIPAAPGYTLQLRRQGERPERFTLGPDTLWTLPPQRALEPGAVYEWTVAANGEGRPARPQRFRVASPAQLSEVETRLAALRASGLDPEREGRFLAATIYRDGGLFLQAEENLRSLADDGAGEGRAFHLLRAEVLERLGRDEEARRERALAGEAG